MDYTSPPWCEPSPVEALAKVRTVLLNQAGTRHETFPPQLQDVVNTMMHGVEDELRKHIREQNFVHVDYKKHYGNFRE